jgi:hypothetical protein
MAITMGRVYTGEGPGELGNNDEPIELMTAKLRCVFCGELADIDPRCEFHVQVLTEPDGTTKAGKRLAIHSRCPHP